VDTGLKTRNGSSPLASLPVDLVTHCAQRAVPPRTAIRLGGPDVAQMVYGPDQPNNPINGTFRRKRFTDIVAMASRPEGLPFEGWRFVENSSATMVASRVAYDLVSALVSRCYGD